jgi:hypothetical protein
VLDVRKSLAKPRQNEVKADLDGFLEYQLQPLVLRSVIYACGFEENVTNRLTLRGRES